MVALIPLKNQKKVAESLKQFVAPTEGSLEYDTCFSYFLDDVEADSGDFDPFDSTLWSIIKLDSTAEDTNCVYKVIFYSFTNRAALIAFINSNGFNIEPWLNYADSISDFADSTNLDDTFALLGQLPPWYNQYSFDVSTALGIGPITNKRLTQTATVHDGLIPNNSSTMFIHKVQYFFYLEFQKRC